MWIVIDTIFLAHQYYEEVYYNKIIQTQKFKSLSIMIYLKKVSVGFIIWWNLFLYYQVIIMLKYNGLKGLRIVIDTIFLAHGYNNEDKKEVYQNRFTSVN